MPIVKNLKLNLIPGLIAGNGGDPDDLHLFAVYTGARLRHVAESLDNRGYLFEAERALSLADDFIRFGENERDTDEFPDLWEELEDWAGTYVDTNGRVDTICSIPTLDHRYAF